MSRQDQLIAALKAMGGKVIESSSRKYTVFSSINMGGYKLYLVGKNGTLRVGNDFRHTIAMPIYADRLIRLWEISRRRL